MIASRAWKGRSYAVLGLARSGRATVAALLESGAKVTAWDEKEEARTALEQLGSGPGRGALKLKDFAATDLASFDAVIVSPGVPLNRHPVAERARLAGVPLIGDVELFAEARAELPPHKVVGITGTNGKSTVTALVHHILEQSGRVSAMAGNIGDPILAQDPLPEGGVYVLELSSFQIDLTRSLDCDIAVLLNITPDHLDRYESFEAYKAAKLRLLEMQSGKHLNFVGENVLGGAEMTLGTVPIAWLEAARQDAWPSLKGPHNAQNAAAAIQVCTELELTPDEIERGLRTFPGLPHRMERVAEKRGVLFVNDSKATNPTSAAPALAAYPPDPEPRLHWILGGQAKSDDLDACAPHFGHVRAAYTIGEAGPMFARLLQPHMPVSECGVLRQAVVSAADAAREGHVVLLSPACASYDQYRDFEERGEDFRACVEALA
ncbi:MAG: UDP-N-acetylmuramoyl-L-alanine--D-glutamate ligase [Sphingomonadaceae bacterium]